MCLAIPACITHIDNVTDTATVSLGEVEKKISIALVDNIEIGDFVLVHVGYALSIISKEEAEKTLSLFSQAGLVADE